LNAGLDGSYELVRGALMVREPAGMRHGHIEVNLLVRLVGGVADGVLLWRARSGSRGTVA
jgi:hypothetical protein